MVGDVADKPAVCAPGGRAPVHFFVGNASSCCPQTNQENRFLCTVRTKASAVHAVQFNPYEGTRCLGLWLLLSGGVQGSMCTRAGGWGWVGPSPSVQDGGGAPPPCVWWPSPGPSSPERRRGGGIGRIPRSPVQIFFWCEASENCFGLEKSHGHGFFWF